MRLFSAIGRGLTAVGRVVFSRNQFRIWSLGRSRIDYLREVGDGTGSSTVTAPLFWTASTFPEAPPALWRKLENRQEEQVLDHPMLRLLERPNDHFTGIELWMATVIDYMVDGNAYWLKLRARSGEPVELWWVPHWLMQPVADAQDGGVFIDHYAYRPIGEAVYRYKPSEVVHFRFGADPDNPRMGRSRLKSVLREVYTDDQAAGFTATILHNMGVPGLVVSPEKGAPAPSPEDAEATKEYMRTAFRGDKRGEPLVMSGPTQVSTFGFSPEQLLLRELRRIPEERTTAVLGVPAIVAGLGAGLDRSTFTNMSEAREAAYESGLIPTQRIIGEKVRWSLLPDFEDDPFLWRFGFDLSKVRVLQEDLFRLAQRHALGVREGCEMVSEYRRALTLEVKDDRDNVFLRSIHTDTVAEGDAGESATPTTERISVPAPAAPAGALNGHAREIADEVVAAIERREMLAAR